MPKKTKNRGRLTFDSVRSIIVAAQFIKDQGGILNFEPTDSMLDRMKKHTRVQIQL